ncbi:MAG: hypothetical protein R2705_17240 [Ilumatobacteraceae bacterium]
MSTDCGARRTTQRRGPRSEPSGTLDTVETISGDTKVYGRVYVGFQGSSFMYGDIRGTPTSSP